MEEWKAISGYEGLYEVSNYGRVRNQKKGGRISKQQMTEDGYMRITIYKRNTKKSYLVHRLVAQEFLDNPDGKSEVNHINAIKTDNSVSNLEWVTHKENMEHANETGLCDINKKSVKCVTTGETFESVRDAQRITGIDRSSISKCCKNKRKSAGKLPDGTKLKWCYVEVA